jgi:predicted nucleic acid-binding protein
MTAKNAWTKYSAVPLPVKAERILFDTSCIVAALTQSHPEHTRAAPWLRRALRGELSAILSAHTLAETYSVLTQLPPNFRAKPADALTLIQRNLTPLEGITLSTQDYLETVKWMVQLGITGGGIYDTLIAKTALNAQVDGLLTLNGKDFIRLGNQVKDLVREP